MLLTHTEVFFLIVVCLLYLILMATRRQAPLKPKNPIGIKACYIVEIQGITENGIHLLSGADSYGYVFSQPYQWGDLKKSSWIENQHWYYSDDKKCIGQIEYHAFRDLSAAEICFQNNTEGGFREMIAFRATLWAVETMNEPEKAERLAGLCASGYPLRYSNVRVMPKFRREKEVA